MSGSVTSSADPGPAGASGPASASAAITHAMNDFMPSSFELVGEWPEPKIVLQRLPEPGEPERLDDEEEEDQAPKHHGRAVHGAVRRPATPGSSAEADNRVGIS